MISRDFSLPVRLDARIGLTVLAIVGAVTFACDRAPLLAPTNSIISLTASTRVVPTGGTAELTATVLENSGSPVPNGTTVRFTTSLGRVEPAEAQTRDGVATARFIAGSESGVADVRAISGLAKPDTTTTTPGTGTGGTPTTTSTAGNAVQITVGAAAANRVTLTANPSTVRPSGSSVEVVAVVADTNGNPLPNVPVSFTTTRGTLNPTVANTDASGTARTTLTASETATVTARVGAGGTNQTATLEVRQSTIASFTLAVTPTNAAAGQPVRLEITPAANTASRVTINWGDGTPPEDIGVVAATRAVTHTYAAPGFYTITASGLSPEGDTFSNSISVTVASQPPVQLDANPTSGNLATNFSFTITPTPGALIENVTISYGPGEGAQDFGPLSTQRTVTHQFQSTGQKTVQVTQRETNGRITTATVTVTVTN